MKQNITISLDKDLIQQARMLAAESSTSISRMLSEELSRIVERSRQYERAKRQALADINKGFHWGGIPANRESLHER